MTEEQKTPITKRLAAPLILSILIGIFFFLVPVIAKALAKHPTFKGAGGDAQNIAKIIQSGLVYPFGKWLPSIWEYAIVVPYWLLIFLLVFFVIRKTKKIWKWVFLAFTAIYLFLFIFPDTLLLFESKKSSVASGSVGSGSLKYGKRVPLRGDNYTTYSFTCYLLGRTHAHDPVRQTVLDAYEICEETCPDMEFLLGEIGHKNGGRFLPHRTHRNGMSVDFMTPLTRKGKPASNSYFRYHLFNLWGYGRDFDSNGKNGNLEIDFETTARHILALDQAAKKNGLRIKKIILAPELRRKMLKTPTGRKITHLTYTKNPVVVRHDDHYHVDFARR